MILHNKFQMNLHNKNNLILNSKKCLTRIIMNKITKMDLLFQMEVEHSPIFPTKGISHAWYSKVMKNQKIVIKVLAKNNKKKTFFLIALFSNHPPISDKG